MPFLEDSLIPTFDFSDRFSYFLDLFDMGDKNPFQAKVDAQKRDLAKNAKEALQIAANKLTILEQLEDSDEVIQNAIQFLTDAATNERRKELAVIQQYIGKIETEYKDFKNNDEIKALIEDLKNFSYNISSSTVPTADLKNFYAKLTTCLNLIRNNLIDFRARVEQITENVEKTRKDLAARQYLYRSVGDTDTLLKSLVGIQTRQVKDSYSGLLREKTFEFIKSKGIGTRFGSYGLPGLLIGVQADLERYIQHEFNYSKSKDTLDEWAKKHIEELFTKYYEASEQEDTRTVYQQKILFNNIEAMTEEFRELYEVIGLKKLDADQQSARLNAIAKQESSRTRKTSARNFVNKAMKELPEYSEMLSDLQLLTWDLDTNNPKSTKHGDVYEQLQVLLVNALNTGRGGGATDQITMGTIHGTINDDAINKTVRHYLLKAKEALLKTNKQARKEIGNTQEIYTEQLNKELNNILKDLDKKLDKLKLPKDMDIFIYHDSLKLYATIEEHDFEKGGRKRSAFDGREQSILNMIDDMYLMADLDGLQFLDQDVLYTLALNLSSQSLGSEFKSTVANYLSIFAGLLMFSDAQNIAQELASDAKKQITYHNIKNIHMYLLNDIYVPGSMILTFISNSIRQGMTKISAINAARTNISTNQADKTIAQYVKDRKEGKLAYNEELWSQYALKVSQGIQARITIFASFVSFIKEIQNTFK